MRERFNGCYFKLQSPEQTIAFIPAEHGEGAKRASSLQIITEGKSMCVRFPGPAFARRPGALGIRIGRSVFCSEYIRLDVRTPGLTAVGMVRFGALTPLRYDIMGPFCWLPGMECRHSVYSMTHAVRGRLLVNDAEYRFNDGVGYIEGDRGRSFPRQYLWTQCLFGGDSLMLSVAEIPVGPLRFTGVIGVVYWRGKEYRLATYLGARVVRLGGNTVVVEQGDMRLCARLLENTVHPLYAPACGAMRRVIRENVVCRAAYRFSRGGKTVFMQESPRASFEYEYPV